MKYIFFFKISCFLFLFLGLGSVRAQQTIPATGGIANGNAGNASYTIGQLNFTSVNGSNGSICQGVQYPFEIYIVSGIENAIQKQINLSIFPNPTSDLLNLKIDANISKKLFYQIFDGNGKLLETQNMNGLETSISMVNYAVATYFINVLDGDQLLKTFKVIKK